MCLCQCLCSQSLDLVLRSLSFTRHWNRKATKKFLNKPLQLEPHLVFSLIHPRGRHFPPFISCDIRWACITILKGVSCPCCYFFKDFTGILPLENTLIRVRTLRNLKGASKFVIWLHITQRKLKTLQKICTAYVVVFKISLDF